MQKLVQLACFEGSVWNTWDDYWESKHVALQSAIH